MNQSLETAMFDLKIVFGVKTNIEVIRKSLALSKILMENSTGNSITFFGSDETKPITVRFFEKV